jgi:hypothetical protein
LRTVLSSVHSLALNVGGVIMIVIVFLGVFAFFAFTFVVADFCVQC